VRFLVLFIGAGCLVTIAAHSIANHAKSETLSRHGERPLRTVAAYLEGWNNAGGVNETRSADLFLTQYGPEGTARAARASLIEAARPDPRVFLAIGAVILLLRVLRDREQMRVERQATSTTAFGNQSSTSAAQDVKKLKAA